MDPTLRPLHRTLRLNTDLLGNALDGLTDEVARRRQGATNPIAFLAAHLIDARCYLARMLGAEAPSPFPALDDATSADDVRELPTLDELRAALAEAERLVEERLEAATAADLARESEQPFPIEDPTVLGGVTFLLQHEAYHLGQVALLRRMLGRPAMSYARRG